MTRIFRALQILSFIAFGIVLICGGFIKLSTDGLTDNVLRLHFFGAAFVAFAIIVAVLQIRIR